MERLPALLELPLPLRPLGPKPQHPIRERGEPGLPEKTELALALSPAGAPRAGEPAVTRAGTAHPGFGGFWGCGTGRGVTLGLVGCREWLWNVLWNHGVPQAGRDPSGSPSPAAAPALTPKNPGLGSPGRVFQTLLELWQLSPFPGSPWVGNLSPVPIPGQLSPFPGLFL